MKSDDRIQENTLGDITKTPLDALNKIFEKGYQVTPEAFKIIQKAPNPVEVVNTILKKISQNSEECIVINAEIVSSSITQEDKKEEPKATSIKSPFSEETITGSVGQIPLAKEYSKDIKILFDPSGKSYSTGKTEDFLKFFRDRYTRIKKIFKKRVDTRGTIDISNLKSVNEKSKIIAMVMEKRETKNGNILLELEDLTGAIIGIINKNNLEVYNKANRILLDQVICFEGKYSSSKMFYIDDFCWPDTSTQHKPRSSEEDLSVALISDVHVGSKNFLEKEFLSFIEWLKGKVGNQKQREIASKIKYLVIGGDLVDGIGVYPHQEKDLEILDIFEQYEKTFSLLENVPEYIEIIIIPGNHDATRQALPQPAIPKEYADELYSLDNITMLGNPAQLLIHGVNFLLFHGRSLDDLSSSVPGASVTKPEKLMKELLISRHLAPQFGSKTPLSPEVRDWLVIEDEPDVFHSGHVHINGMEKYRNILIVNSGTWQGQTDYQKRLGISPTPCNVPIYNLKTNIANIMKFYQK